jgi:ABC-2 type transport system ATP-binding protein
VPALRALGLVKRFETTVAVDRVDLTINEGEVRGLLGPNGAGKTTLLRLLFGLVRPDAGSIELLGRSGTQDLSQVAGFVEEPTFYPYLSGRANLEVLAELDDGTAQDRIDEVLEWVELLPRAGDRLNGYSTGMKQRLGIAAALLRAPRLLLLDEPTSGLDPAGAREVRRLLHGLAEDGVTVLVSSHQIGEIEGACDSFTVVRRGSIVWEGTAAELRAQAPPSEYALSTSDDRKALEVAARHEQVHVAEARAGGLSLRVPDDQLDAYTLALGQAGVAIRRLELLVSPLESMFFALTGDETP